MKDMREALIQVCRIADENGNIYQFSYYRLEDSKSYGVCIRDQDGAVAMISDITSEYERIDALLDLLIRGCVSPLHLPEIVEDWLIA